MLSFKLENPVLTRWSDVSPLADALIAREIHSSQDFAQWLHDWNDFESALEEQGTWRYIRMSQDSIDPVHTESYNAWIEHFSEPQKILRQQLQEKLLACPFHPDGHAAQAFALLKRRMANSNALYREENLPLLTEEETTRNMSAQLRSGLSVTIDGETMTLEKASALQDRPDRSLREKGWRGYWDAIRSQKEPLDNILSNSIALRHKIALNAGFSNFRDYSFAAKARFDYTPQTCFDFHESVEKFVVPLYHRLLERRAKLLGLEKLRPQLRPWDLVCNPKQTTTRTLFKNGDDLIDKGIQAINDLDPELAEALKQMRAHKLFDLDSRAGKRSGAYNAPLYKAGFSFMFGNVAGTQDNIGTFFHEAGHACHDYLSRDLHFIDYRRCPEEICELASYGMELLPLAGWSYFFEPHEKSAALLQHINDSLRILIYVAQVDAFQHALYLNPDWTQEQRHEYWLGLEKRFASPLVDWSGLEDYRRSSWHRLNHIFESPFYMIEYGFARMGAYQIWQNFVRDPVTALEQYKAALRLGYTRSIPEIYKVAGAEFDFAPNKIASTLSFVKEQIEQLI
jgi:oligoendopeptidase F